MNAFHRRSSFVCALMLLAGAPPAAAAPDGCSATSGRVIPSVVELYTSEGCDSCPPADRWLSGLKGDAARGRVVPLAFHVDYWDYIGWKDRFADPAFGVRHRERASRGGAKVIYTPQVLVDGRETLLWRKPGADALPSATALKPSRAALTIAATPSPASAPAQLQLRLTGSTVKPDATASAYVALFENEVSSDVKAGENKGVLLRHDFVVRRWSGPFAFERGTLNVSNTIDLPADAQLARSGIAVMALDDRGGVLQAVALPLRDCAR